MPPNRLAALRQKEGLSQAELAYQLGITASTIWRWEHSRVGIPDATKLWLAARFDVDVAYLMGWPEREAA